MPINYNMKRTLNVKYLLIAIILLFPLAKLRADSIPITVGSPTPSVTIDDCGTVFSGGPYGYKGFFNDIEIFSTNGGGGFPCSGGPPFIATLNASPWNTNGAGILRFDFWTSPSFSGSPAHTFELFFNGSTTSSTWTSSGVADNTRIINTTPVGTISSSTSPTLGYTGYLNINDIDSYSRVIYQLSNSNSSFQQCADVICSEFSQNSITITRTTNLATFGLFGDSTTTPPLPIGKYYVKITIQKGSYCLFGICAGHQDIYATTTSFLVATSTKIDKLKNSVSDYIAGLSSNANNFEDCSVLSFSFFSCFADLATLFFVPNTQSIQYAIDSTKTGFLAKPPFGYLTRFTDILVSSSTTALPAFTVPIRTQESTTTGTINLTYDMNDMVLGAGTVLADTRDPYNGKNFKDIFLPIIQFIVAMSVLVVIVKDIMGSHKHQSDMPVAKNAK